MRHEAKLHRTTYVFKSGGSSANLTLLTTTTSFDASSPSVSFRRCRRASSASGPRRITGRRAEGAVSQSPYTTPHPSTLPKLLIRFRCCVNGLSPGACSSDRLASRRSTCFVSKGLSTQQNLAARPLVACCFSCSVGQPGRLGQNNRRKSGSPEVMRARGPQKSRSESKASNKPGNNRVAPPTSRQPASIIG